VNYTAPLADIFEFIRNGKSVKQDRSTGGLPITRIETIADGTIDSARVGYAGLQEAGNEKWLLQKGDILFSHINSVNHIGKCALFEGHPEKLVHGMNLLALRPKKQVLDARYACRAMSNPNFRASLQQFVNKAVNQASISTTNLKSLEIPLPPLDEQQRIAAILDKADALRRKRKRAIDLLNSLTQSIFLEMFGQRRDSVSELKDVVKEGTIVTYGIVQAGPEYPGGVPYIRTGDLIDGSMKLDGLRRTDPMIAARFSRSRVEAGDIVMSIRATVGTTAVVPKELEGANLTQGTARIAPGASVQCNYLVEYLRAEKTQRWIAAQVKGATFLEITLGRLRELPVAVPPMDLQKKFSDTVERLQGSRKNCSEQATLANCLFTSLQSRAFLGQL
jgi:type I restriction enzyme, S subunit